MANATVVGLVLVGLVTLPGGLTIDEKIVTDLLGVSESHLALLSRGRRDLQGDIQWFNLPTDKTPFCHCGKESWLKGFAKVNGNETKKCARDLNVNLTGLKEDEILSAAAKLLESAVCQLDCIFQKLNLVNSEGNLKKSEIKELFKDNVFVDGDLKEIGSTVVDRCLTNGTDNTLISEGTLSLAQNATCGKDPLKFINCMLIEMVQDCPEVLKRYDVDHCKNLYSLYGKGRQASHSTEIN